MRQLRQSSLGSCRSGGPGVAACGTTLVGPPAAPRPGVRLQRSVLVTDLPGCRRRCRQAVVYSSRCQPTTVAMSTGRELSTDATLSATQSGAAAVLSAVSASGPALPCRRAVAVRRLGAHYWRHVSAPLRRQQHAALPWRDDVSSFCLCPGTVACVYTSGSRCTVPVYTPTEAHP